MESWPTERRSSAVKPRRSVLVQFARICRGPLSEALARLWISREKPRSERKKLRAPCRGSRRLPILDVVMRRVEHSTDALLLLSIAETSRLLGLSRATIYRLIDGRELATISIGSRRLVRARDLEAFIESRMDDAQQKQRSPAGQPSFARTPAEETRGHDGP